MANGNFGGGTGTSSDPYLVEDAQDLNAVRNDLYAYYKQTANIDLSIYSSWIPIGKSTSRFWGEYNGDKFKISNLTINWNGNEREAGLFGYLYGAYIENVIIEDCYVSSAKNGVGALAGICNRSNILNCCVIGNSSVINTQSVYMVSEAGGLFGVVFDSAVHNCFSHASVNAKGSDVGGLVGMSDNILLMNSFAKCDISALEDYPSENYGAGGLIGYPDNSCQIDHCYFAGTITVPCGNYSKIGGIYGFGWRSYPAPSLSYNYFDYTLFPNNLGISNIYPKSTSQMKQQATFVNWNFSTVWGIDSSVNDGYPHLLWSIKPLPVNVKNVWVKKASSIKSLGYREQSTYSGEVADFNIFSSSGALNVVSNNTRGAFLIVGNFNKNWINNNDVYVKIRFRVLNYHSGDIYFTLQGFDVPLDYLSFIQYPDGGTASIIGEDDHFCGVGYSYNLSSYLVFGTDLKTGQNLKPSGWDSDYWMDWEGNPVTIGDLNGDIISFEFRVKFTDSSYNMTLQIEEFQLINRITGEILHSVDFESDIKVENAGTTYDSGSFLTPSVWQKVKNIETKSSILINIKHTKIKQE